MLMFNFVAAVLILITHHGRYRVVLHSDEVAFGGHARLDAAARHFTEPMPFCNREYSMLVYLPSRTAIVYALAED